MAHILSARAAWRAAAGPLMAAALLCFLPVRGAAADAVFTLPGGGHVDSGPAIPPGAAPPTPAFNMGAARANAVGGGTNGSLAAMNAAIPGQPGFPATGLYIGNEFYNKSDATIQSWFNQIHLWGFQFVCPKVGGYGKVWYSSVQYPAGTPTTTRLQTWNTLAKNAGLVLVPFLYSIPNSTVDPNEHIYDARNAAAIANICGVVVLDMEDEWGKSGGTYYNSQMTAFGNTYRALAPDKPIIVTGYGDPVTRFGAASYFPYTQMKPWADGYSPQWYFGYWNPYARTPNTANVRATINWADGECATALGASYPLAPSLGIYNNSGVMPVDDIHTALDYARLWRAPIFWWEYGDMDANVAAACLGYGYFGATPVALSAPTVVSGDSVTGTVTLDGLAPPAGQLVTLTANGAAAIVPSYTRAAAGSSAAVFTIHTRDVLARTSVTITANLRGKTQSTTLAVLPPCDVNGDEMFNAADVALTLDIAGGLQEATPAQRQVADLDGDGAVTASDAVAILRRLNGL